MDADVAQLLWEQRRFCEILGVCPLATAAEIKKARRRLQLVHHSDKGSTGAVSAIINQACDALLLGVAGECELRWATAFPDEARPMWAATHETGIRNLRAEKKRIEQRRGVWDPEDWRVREGYGQGPCKAAGNTHWRNWGKS